LLLLDRQGALDPEGPIDVDRRTVRGASAPGPGPTALRVRAPHREWPLVDDLQRVVQVVQVAAERLEDLLEGVERGLLFPRLVGGKHGLGDARGLRDLILPLALAVSEPAQGPP